MSVIATEGGTTQGNQNNRCHRIQQLIDELESTTGSYHVIDFGEGLVLPGEYDMRKVIHHYGLPEDMSGMTVLDVGTATGFFAFECARRGGTVTATDIWEGTMFGRIRDGLGLDVRYFQKNLYDLTENFGRFDLVICGSLLLHLRDVFGAIQCLRSVCGRQLVLTNSYVDVPSTENRALAEFIGVRARSESGEYWVYWNLTPECLLKMVKACDFAKAQEVDRFELISEPGRSGFRVPHVVVHGFVE